MAKHKLRHKKNPGLVLKELIGSTSTCTDCNTEKEIDWLAETKFPHEAIEPHGGGGHWVPISFSVFCSECDKYYFHEVPVVERECPWHIYGDEAGRIIEADGKRIHFFCLTLVGLHKNKHELLQKRLNKFKLEARPDLAPEDWTHHFYEIWSDSGPDRRFAFTGVDQKVRYGERLAKLISDMTPELISYNFSSAIILSDSKRENAQAIKKQKEDLFKQALLFTMHAMRENRKSAIWHFDNVKDTTLGEATEGWALECFLGLQYTPLFTYLAAGAYTPQPEFVKPGSHYLLETADFISFCVARDFLKISQGKVGEIPSARLGKMMCYRVMEDGQPDERFEMGTHFLQRYFRK